MITADNKLRLEKGSSPSDPERKSPVPPPIRRDPPVTRPDNGDQNSNLTLPMTTSFHLS